MLHSISATEPYLWTCVPAPGVEQVARASDYLFCFPDLVNELLADDDLIPDDPAEIAIRQK